MPKLVIHAPLSKAQQQGKRSFAQTIATGVGDGYAINRRLRQQLNPGDGVVVLDKDTRQRADRASAEWMDGQRHSAIRRAHAGFSNRDLPKRGPQQERCCGHLIVHARSTNKGSSGFRAAISFPGKNVALIDPLP